MNGTELVRLATLSVVPQLAMGAALLFVALRVLRPIDRRAAAAAGVAGAIWIVRPLFGYALSIAISMFGMEWFGEDHLLYVLAVRDVALTVLYAAIGGLVLYGAVRLARAVLIARRAEETS
ncbi:MAG: hypothetical protein AB7S26_20970 [Sandaracinaceae bacterium]